MAGHDLRYALRTLARNPGFAFVSILALALGIGANSAIFTVVNSVLLEPMHFKQADQLVVLRERNLGLGFPEFSISPANYLSYRDQNRSLSGLAGIVGGSMSYVGSQEPERLRTSRVTQNFFDVMGAQPLLGRGFTKEENVFGADHVVLVGYGLWQRRFGARANVLGERINLSGEMYTIVGVMPKDFDFPSRIELWRPLTMKQEDWARRGGHYMAGIGRLKPGVSVVSAENDLQTISSRLRQAYPDTNHGWDCFLVGLQERTVGKIRPMMLTILAAVGFVLLIACVNLANLLLSRSSSRRKEIGIRGALGASKMRLIRQLLTESLVLSAFGTLFGLGLAWAGTRLLSNVSPNILPRATEISLDMRAVAITALIGVLTGVLFGLAPALQMARADLNSSLREGGRGNSMGFRRNLLRSVLVTGEVALALVLLSGAGLLMRSFYSLTAVDLGFDSHGLLIFSLNLPNAKYAKDEQQTAFFNRALEGLRALPGVSSVGAATIFPLSGSDTFYSFRQLGKPPVPSGQEPSAMYYGVAPGYFETLHIPLKAGRYLTAADSANASKVMVISESLAHKFYPNQNPIGQRIAIGGGPGNGSEIVGVVGNVHDEELESNGRESMYQSINQSAENSLFFAVRTQGDPDSLISAVRTVVHGLDAELPLDAVGTVDALVESSLSQRRFSMLLMGVFAALALALAVIGIYGVLAYSVNQATQEIGIRVALGAKRGDVLRLVFAYGGGLVAVGIIIGVAVAFAAGNLLASQLYEVRATDPLTYIVVAVALALAGFAACLIPALRAVRVDPIIALRAE
ncbi:MAG TPA: ABC transporter permease [Bryobacteraceae bacterium]|nr:ABC transporter permease [Bryobacteraceae bacterium]